MNADKVIAGMVEAIRHARGEDVGARTTAYSIPKLADLKAGDAVVTDDGFTCMPLGQKIVEADEHGLFVRCSEGQHYLDGQEGDDGSLIGIFRANA